MFGIFNIDLVCVCVWVGGGGGGGGRRKTHMFYIFFLEKVGGKRFTPADPSLLSLNWGGGGARKTHIFYIFFGKGWR